MLCQWQIFYGDFNSESNDYKLEMNILFKSTGLGSKDGVMWPGMVNFLSAATMANMSIRRTWLCLSNCCSLINLTSYNRNTAEVNLIAIVFSSTTDVFVRISRLLLHVWLYCVGKTLWWSSWVHKSFIPNTKQNYENTHYLETAIKWWWLLNYTLNTWPLKLLSLCSSMLL